MKLVHIYVPYVFMLDYCWELVDIWQNYEEFDLEYNQKMQVKAAKLQV